MNFFIKLKKLISSLYYLSTLDKINYVFFSEKKNYKYYLLPLLNKIADQQDKKILYLSSEVDDLIQNKLIVNLYIGTGFFRMVILNLVKCKYFFLTMTDLGNNEFLRNKKIDNYVYIFHSPQSTHKIYTENAFDNYDIICCNGNYHYDEIRKRETIFNLKKKKLIKSGYLYLEFLLKNISLNKNSEHILFAPSWNYNERNLFDEYSLNVLDYLLDNNFKIIFRPHQEHYKRSKHIIEKLIKNYENKNNFMLDQNDNNLFALSNSNLLITDYSGIALEFLFVFKKPFIIVNDLKKIHNKNFEKINKDTFEEKVYREFGHFVESSNLLNIKEDINEAKKKFEFKKKKLEEFLNTNTYDFQTASEKIYQDLIKKN